jgi:parallel beta-helix repeat protein
LAALPKYSTRAEMARRTVMKSEPTKTGIGLLLFGCLLAATGRSAKADETCGATILADVKLEQDLTCAGDGLIAGADRIRIDLNGHSLSGGGTGVGITVIGRTDVTIVGGRIENFAVGVRVNTSTDVVIQHNELVGNPEGIDLQAGSVGAAIKDNAFSDSITRAIMLRSNSHDNDIKNNAFTGNRIGILVFGGVDNTLKDNLISGSTLAGIRINVIATGNVLKHNTVTSNAVGIDFIITATGSAVGNELKANTITANTCGLKGPTEDNTLKENTFDANVADVCS